MPAISTQLIQRLLLERDLLDSRTLTFTCSDDVDISFELKTLSAAEKDTIKKQYDGTFPVPPTIVGKTGIASFDLENPAYQKQLIAWSMSLTHGILAATIGLSECHIKRLEQLFPTGFVTELFSTVELLNGIQSDPLSDLVKEALWAPEVLTWMETSTTKPSELKITETPLYREMDCIVAAGLTLAEWDKLSPRERMIYLNWRDYSQAKEAYVHDFYEKKSKKDPRGLNV